MDETEVWEWTGKNEGIPSRLFKVPVRPDTDDADKLMKEFEAKGCCAWVGRTGCGAPTNDTALMGESKVLFSSYRSMVIPDAGVLVVGCDRHLTGNGADWVKDMPRSLRRSQEKERQKYNRLIGRPDA